MRAPILLLCLSVLFWGSCSSPKEESQLRDIKLMEAGNVAIIANKIKVAHMICAELGHCENNNDTIMTTYYDDRGRLIKIWQPNEKSLEEYHYSDESNWETKRIFIAEGRKDTQDVKYWVNKKDRILTEYTLAKSDTVATLQYRFDEDGKVYQYGPDRNNIIYYLQYNDDGFMTKETRKYVDTTTYLRQYGNNDLYVAYKAEEEFFYYEGHLDSSVRKYYDVYDHKFFEPVYFKYRYDGLMESIQGTHRYMFSYEK